MKARRTLDAKNRRSVVLFVFGQFMAFLFVTLLQVSPMWMFLPFLVLMHVGIALFIMSRKRLLEEKKSVTFHFRIVYGLLALYLPLLAFKLIGRVFDAGFEENLIAVGAYTLAAICLVVAPLNAVKMVRTLQSE